MGHVSLERQSPPSDFHCLKEMIAKREVTFPRCLEKVAEFVLARPDIVAFESSIFLANTCGVSTATIIRFARHLGFKNFRDMKCIFRSCLSELAQ